jgi:type 1 fimbria pilin
MKKTLIALNLGLLLASQASVAADSATVDITGTLSPTTCNITPSVTDIDLGEFSYDEVSSESADIVTEQSSVLTLNFKCGTSSNVGYRFYADMTDAEDNDYWDFSNSTAKFPLFDEDGVAAGYYYLDWNDGENHTATYDDGSGTTTSGNSVVNYNSLTGVMPYYDAETFDSTGTDYVFDMRGYTVQELLDASTDNVLSGSFTVEFVY